MRFIPRPEPGEYAPYTVDEYTTVRESTLSLFEGFPEAALTRVGTASGNPMSVRSGAFHIAGHELHHLDSIRLDYGGTTAS